LFILLELGNRAEMDFIRTISETEGASACVEVGQASIIGHTLTSVDLNGSVNDIARHLGSNDLDHRNILGCNLGAVLVDRVSRLQSQ